MTDHCCLKPKQNLDTGKWFVIDSTNTKQAGDFETEGQADAWIAQQNAINEWTDS